jgi:hypothetical protein
VSLRITLYQALLRNKRVITYIWESEDGPSSGAAEDLTGYLIRGGESVDGSLPDDHTLKARLVTPPA